MRKLLNKQGGNILVVVLVIILVMGLITPVMLTTATYGMKNTIATNDNFNARYLADTAYQETLNRVNIAKNSSMLLDKNDIMSFVSRQLININGSLNGGTYSTNYHPDYPNTLDKPKIISNFGGDPKKVKYTYYLRSTGKVDSQTAFVDYTISFIQKKIGGTIILYEQNNKGTTFDRLPIAPDNLKEIASGELGLNGKVNTDINNKLNGSTFPNIPFKYEATTIPSFYKNELSSSEIINKSVRVSKINLKNKSSITINGNLYVDNDITLGSNVSLTVNGNFYIGGNFTASNNESLKVSGDLIVKNSINFNNNIFFDIGGNIFVQGALNIENNASRSRIGGSLYVMNNFNLGNNGQLKVQNDIVANNIILTNNNNLKTGGEVLVKNEFNAQNNAYVELAGGLGVGTRLKISNNVEFKFAQKLYITNALEFGNNGKMLLIKTGEAGSGASYMVDIEDPEKL